MGSVCDRGHSEQIQGVTLDGQVTGRQSGQWHKWLHQEADNDTSVGAGPVL
jgi:hypothetical protein